MKMLAIDLGASSGRGIVGNFDGDKLTLNEIHRFSNDPVMVNGTFHWDTLRIFYEIKTALNQCAISDDKDIKSMAIDTWGVDFGLLDKNGRLLGNPHHYRDALTEGIQEYAFGIVPAKKLYGQTGIQFMNFNTVFQLAARLKEDPTSLDRAEKLLFTPDLLNYFLTGEMGTEYCIASTSALVDAKTRNWAKEIINGFGIPERLFTEISMPGTRLGKLSASITEEFGGAISPDVYMTASHDTASAVAAVPAAGEDFIYISSGTWSLMGSELGAPETGDKAFDAAFTNEGGVGGKIRFHKNIMGLWLEQESRRQWAREGTKVSYNDLSDMAVASKPFRSFIDPEDERFSAPGNMPRRIADYCRETGQPVPETMGEVVRCIFDSLAMKYRQTAELIDSFKGHRIPYVNIVGGGTKEEPLCRFTASACGRPVIAGPTEATAIGNLAVQAIGAGEIKDLAEAREVCRRSFDVKEYEPTDTDMWDEAYGKFLKIIEKK